MGSEPITGRELNRALLARQGLLERHASPPGLGEVVAAVGALQMQYWPALGPALWSRVEGLPAGEPHRAHASGDLLTGTLLRGTIHTVPAPAYPAYAVATVGSRVGNWQRSDDQPGPEVVDLERGLLAYAAEPRSADELSEFIEGWVARHPGVLSDAELGLQRTYKWRPWRSSVWLVRVPADGQWGPKTPTAYRSVVADDPPTTEEALATVVRDHLRAFGPAAAQDIAAWIHWNITPVRRALEQLDATDDLVTLVDETGQLLYDLAAAPRPGADVEAPVRLLGWFDSTLLAYAPKRRTRILPDAYRDIVYVKANGQLKPSFLVDGLVAGMWSLGTARTTATLTLVPLQRLGAATRKALLAEAEGLVRFCHPDVTTHEVRFDD